MAQGINRIARRPVIGITSDYYSAGTRYQLKCDYTTAVERAGGLPFIIPFRTDRSLIGEIVDCLDGIIFAGGDDLDPSLYGEARHPRAEPLDLIRQQFELAVMEEVERRRLPALGICLGSQMMNVHRGGSLNQFLPEIPREQGAAPLEHRRMGTDETRHMVHVAKDSAVARAVGTTDISANSSHKQSVRKVGRGLRVIATSPDGIIEGIEDPTLPLFIGVQWHPERLHNEPEHLALFRLLVEKSAAERRT